ncbi:hypothetical protein RB195_007570 [Necator americanus]|uniref:Uncharacterized protein n=1 Tax=Necator americanus TaxID=51031 RepID=A0ABR1C1N5_NECAM
MVYVLGGDGVIQLRYSYRSATDSYTLQVRSVVGCRCRRIQLLLAAAAAAAAVVVVVVVVVVPVVVVVVAAAAAAATVDEAGA